MLGHIAQRIAQMLATLLILSLLIFLLARVLGDPVTFMLPLDARPEDVERLRQLLGLDAPLHQQYWQFLQGLLQGDLGESIRQQQPVTDIVFSRLGPSVQLAALAVGWALVVSVALGTLAAAHRGGAIDRGANAIAILGQASPSFWVGLMLVQLFSVRLGWLPAAGHGEGDMTHIVLPALTLGLVAIAGLTRLVRSSLLEVLASDFIVKARIMGVPAHKVLISHGLRNALLPVVTYAGELFAALISASVAVEVVFAWPGVGRLAYEAVFTRDYPLIQGVVLIIAVIVMLVNLAVDLLYAFLDPRVHHG